MWRQTQEWANHVLFRNQHDLKRPAGYTPRGINVSPRTPPPTDDPDRPSNPA